jgi:hypothetical protein
MYSFGPDDIALGTPMDEVYRLARRASQLFANVLILGERQIHRFRDPEERGFKVYRCCSSELDFGDIRRLLFMDTDKGNSQLPSTLFLKSLERVSDKAQLRLLKVLDEEKTLGLLTGSSVFRKPRVMCSSEKDWAGMHGGSGILPSLAYHLDVIHIEIPPLRERKAEILFLANLFLRKYKVKYRKELTGFSLEVRCGLLDYDWPGNVRELRNVVEEAVILTQGSVVRDLCLL